MLYVGELCRYLIATPPSPYDRAHKCIVATGNGLQKDVWIAFKRRFGVPEIREYYRSTEGLAKFDNRNRGTSGAGKVGYSGLLRRAVEDDVFIVKFDYENERPHRDPKTGFCIPAVLGEAGEAIGRIRSMATYVDYLGNPEATEAKILRDVFKKGDMFQRSGDLLVQDPSGWVRFHDRIGETFRWKGENVSAGEISGFIRDMENVHDAIVVGKRLKG
jgi:acyl-CoA synthetase (AMP-forming)/AMP-acid ligase II